MWHTWRTGEAHKGFWWGDLTERGDFKHLDIDGSIILKWISQEMGGGGMDWVALSQDR